MEQIEVVHEKTKAQDRVTLGLIESQKIEAWLTQIAEHSKGFLSLSKSDVVNFLVRHYKDAFTSKDLMQLRADHYDPIRHITWIAPQIKQALAAGDMERVSALQEELRKVELSTIVPGQTLPTRQRQPRTKRKKQNAELQDVLPEAKQD